MVESTSHPCRTGAVPPARAGGCRAHPPDSCGDAALRPGSCGDAALRPDGLHDLRTGAAPSVLRYGAADVLVVTGLPGAGKSTLMARCVDARVIDSQHVRDWYQSRLPERLPYLAFRPLVRATHYARLGLELRGGGPMAVHDCGTIPLVRAAIREVAACQSRDVHLLHIDADAATALAGQRARGRCVSAGVFARHRRVAQRTVARLLTAGAPPRGWRSATLLGRPAAQGLRAITFGTEG